MTDTVNQTGSGDTPTPMRGAGAVVMWALFLGCSWTWVIGMFLPVLLVRDYGLWGWVAFAVPNVLGAAALGFVVKDADASRALVERHASACRWFGRVTVAYQAYLIGALAGPLGLAAAGIVTVAILAAGRSVPLRDTFAALIVFAVSLGLFAYAQTTAQLWTHLDPAMHPGRLPTINLAMFIPAAVFGFALCPYLDLTFHRARQATTPGAGRAAFAIGFGVVFFSMTVFSLAYAGVFENVTAHIGHDLAPKLWPVLLVQLMVQGGFTAAVHIRSLRRPTATGKPGEKSGEKSGGIAGGKPGGGGSLAEFGLALAIAIGLMLGLGALLIDGEPAPWLRTWRFVTSVTELGYRAFLLLYGTVFPAYVLICMIPTYRQVSHKSRLVLFAVAATLSYPLACAAFIANRSLWVLPILAVMVIGRIVVEMLPVEKDL